MKSSVIAAALFAVFAAAPAHAGDADKGAKVFNKCKACHKIGEGAKSGVGPELNGVVGRKIGMVEGFKYSSVFQEKAEAEMVWTVENLSAFLAKPKDFAAGTKMSFAGLRKESDVENVLAYLAGFAADGSEQDAEAALEAAK